MDNMPVWVTVVVGLLTALGGGLGVWILNLYNSRNKHLLDEDKQDRDIRMNENEQAFKIYRELVDTLKKDVSKLSVDLATLERERLSCREENAQLKAELRAQGKEIEYLKLQAGIKTNPLHVPPLIEEKK